MTRLQELHVDYDQSPWLDNLRRDSIQSGELARMVEDGIRGITSNPSIFQKAIEGSDAYDEQFSQLIAKGVTVEDAYWELVVTDITDALAILAPVHDASDGTDGFVSVEVAPGLAHDRDGTIAAAQQLHDRIDRPNLYVKIPGTAEGVGAIEEMIARGKSINVTLLFSVKRYGEIIDAYLNGLERFRSSGGDLRSVRSVASFFVSRVDSAVDKRLDALGTPEAKALRGKAAIANAKLAYELYQTRFSGERWESLVEAGAHPQRPLWASTSTKDPSFTDTLYVDALIGPETVNTIPDATIEAFEDHGTLARTIDTEVDVAHEQINALAKAGIDIEEIAEELEEAGVEAFVVAFDELLATLSAKADKLEAGG